MPIHHIAELFFYLFSLPCVFVILYSLITFGPVKSFRLFRERRIGRIYIIGSICSAVVSSYFAFFYTPTFDTNRIEIPEELSCLNHVKAKYNCGVVELTSPRKGLLQSLFIDPALSTGSCGPSQDFELVPNQQIETPHGKITKLLKNCYYNYTCEVTGKNVTSSITGHTDIISYVPSDKGIHGFDCLTGELLEVVLPKTLNNQQQRTNK